MNFLPLAAIGIITINIRCGKSSSRYQNVQECDARKALWQFLRLDKNIDADDIVSFNFKQR